MKTPLRLFAAALILCQTPCLQAEPPLPTLAGSMKPFIDRQELAGVVVLVADKDKVLATEAVGAADIATNRPMTTDTLFWIASMTKPMTGAAFMMLVDEGKVKMDDPVEKYLPEFKGQMVIEEKDDNHVLLKKPVHPILLRNILNHTSGLPFLSPVEANTIDMISLETVTRTYANSPLLFQPDSKYLYSNAGINTAGRIIEVVTGMTYGEFMQKRLFDPLGMKETTFIPTEEQVQRLATSYTPNAAKDGLEPKLINYLHYPLTNPKRQPAPGGGLFSTAEDVAHFCQMVLNNGVYQGQRLLSEESVRQMTSRQTPAELKDSYGYGWAATGPSFGHGGAYSTNMTIDTTAGLVTVYMVQQSGQRGEGGKAGGVFQTTARNLFGLKK